MEEVGKKRCNKKEERKGVRSLGSGIKKSKERKKNRKKKITKSETKRRN